VARPPDDLVRIASWNVNGLRACAKRGFMRWMGRSGAEIVGVQEVRARPDDLPRSLASPRGWHARWAAAERPGYSGVGVYSRRPPDEVDPSLGVRAFDAEGRVLMARFGGLVVVSAYFPNGNGQDRDNSRVPYKLRFSRRLYRVLLPGSAAAATCS
jgi:exodeoxyribonuclease-3